MSVGCFKAWQNVPKPELVRLRAEAKPVFGSNLPSLHVIVHVGDWLAWRFQDEKGVVDETVEQLTALMHNVVSQGPVLRALRFLDYSGLWTIRTHGGGKRGTTRVPSFYTPSTKGTGDEIPSRDQRRTGDEFPSRVQARTGDDYEQNWRRSADELATISSELRTSERPTPKNLLRELPKRPPYDTCANTQADRVAEAAMEAEETNLNMTPLGSPLHRARRLAEYRDAATLAIEETGSQEVPIGALARVLAYRRHDRKPPDVDLYTVQAWKDDTAAAPDDSYRPTCSSCNDTGHVFDPDSLNSHQCKQCRKANNATTRH